MRNGYNLNWGVVDANVIAVNPAVSADMERSHMEIAYYGEGPASTWPYALRIHDSGMVLSIEAFLASLRSVQLRAIDYERSLDSELDAILWELQHPKQTLYVGPDVALPAGVPTFLTPWINVSGRRMVGWYIANTGAAQITAETVYWSEDPAGVGPFLSNSVSAFVINVATAAYSQQGTVATGVWSYQYTAPLTSFWVRIGATSNNGSIGRALVIGMR